MEEEIDWMKSCIAAKFQLCTGTRILHVGQLLVRIRSARIISMVGFEKKKS